MKNLRILLDKKELDYDVSSYEFPISIDYAFEDVVDFQKKKGNEALDINLPATLSNQGILNSFGNVNIIDVSEKEASKNIKDFRIIAFGDEVFSGMAIPKSAKKQHGKVKSVTLNAFGGNSEWIISLSNLTLYDILKPLTIPFTKENIINSWDFDGKNENIPFVFAPVKYAVPMDRELSNDTNYSMDNMKPSISAYWIIYWAFKSIGYTIESKFLDSNYFRRMVTPWTWGPFLTSEGTKYEIHKIEAKTKNPYSRSNYFLRGDVIDVDVTNILLNNNNTIEGGDYKYVNKRMQWKYNTPDYGKIQVQFGINIFYDLQTYHQTSTSRIKLVLRWYKNGTLFSEDEIIDLNANTNTSKSVSDNAYYWKDVDVVNGDIIECEIYAEVIINLEGTFNNRVKVEVHSFKTNFFKIPEGGTVSFDSYLGLQKIKFVDFFKGIIDCFNLSLATNSSQKSVLIEPTHPYSITKELYQTYAPGYFNGNTLNWSNIEDLEVESEVMLYSDAAREYIFKFKDDTSDGALKIVQDRHKITLGSSKYVFSERFKDKNEFENRFFSPTMHYFCDDFKDITGISPQLVSLVPENISNTSSGEAQNTFEPKLCFYKGRVNGVGGWRFKDQNNNITVYQDFPFMFSVNYQVGGENDPCLSYTDERIGDNENSPIAPGLMKRFFIQRLAIMNHGIWNTTNFKLQNIHITNWYHRENIVTNNIRWEIININNYNPLNDSSTKVTLRQWFPVTQKDYDSCFPSDQSVKTGKITTNYNSSFDLQYQKLMCLYGDIPRDKK